jgi:hypothetical protein
MKRSLIVQGCVAFVASALFAIPLTNAQDTGGVLWDAEVDNLLGMVLVTDPAGMSNGADRSRIAVNGGTFGFGAQLGAPNRVADRFVVDGEGWVINCIRLCVYQTNTVNAALTAPTITGVDVNIWLGDPGTGTLITASPIIGPFTVSLANIFRTTNGDNANFQRHIQYVDIEVNPTIKLDPGTYHLDWALTGSLVSGPWQPPLTLAGGTGLVEGTAWQATAAGGGVFNPLLDATAGIRVAFPFIIKGKEQMGFILGDVNCDGVVNLLDVAPFVALLTSGGFSPKADINGDGAVTLLDVAGFVQILTGG